MTLINHLGILRRCWLRLISQPSLSGTSSFKGSPWCSWYPWTQRIEGRNRKLCVAILYDVAIVVLQYMVFALR